MSPAQDPVSPASASVEIRDASGYHRHHDADADARWRLRELCYARGFRAEASIPGWCELCEAPTRFAFTPPGQATDVPNWREALHCAQCGLFSRIRFSLAQAHQLAGLDRARIYATEQAT